MHFYKVNLVVAQKQARVFPFKYPSCLEYQQVAASFNTSCPSNPCYRLLNEVLGLRIKCLIGNRFIHCTNPVRHFNFFSVSLCYNTSDLPLIMSRYIPYINGFVITLCATHFL